MSEVIKGLQPEVKGGEYPFAEFAPYYDILYQDKDYAGEASFVSGMIDIYIPRQREDVRVLDLACGTGRHAMELTRMGYSVEGSDISSQMIAVARAESITGRCNIVYHNESFQTADKIDRKFDVVISMFSAINFLATYEDFAKALKNICSLLTEDGIFIFDFWNGNAVVNDFSPVRVKRMSRGDKEVFRYSNTIVDRVLQSATLEFRFILIENLRIVREFTEIQNLRYFFLQEMSDLLKANGLELLLRCPFMKPDCPISEMDWNVTCVVRRRI